MKRGLDTHKSQASESTELDTHRARVLDDLDLPARLRTISTGVSEAEFRADISSTALRARRANDG